MHTRRPLLRRRLLLAAVAIVVGASVTIVAEPAPRTRAKHSVARVAAARHQADSASCPRHVLNPGPHALEGVTRALRATVPRIRVVAYGRTVRSTPSNTAVLDLRPLAGDGANLPGIRTITGFSSYYGKLAQRLCGSAVTIRSWLAIVQFAEAQAVPFSYRYLLFARTAAGWKLWRHGSPVS